MQLFFFWLRFFGYKQNGLDGNKDVDSSTIFGGPVTSRPRKSIMYDPAEVRNLDTTLAPLDGDLAAARKGTHRRSAIDLVRGDLGAAPGVRRSLDNAPTRQKFMAAPLNTYTDFTTMHMGRVTKIVSATHKFTGAEVAIKMYDRTTLSPTEREEVAKEVEILRKARGASGIVEIEKAIEDDYLTAIVLRCCTGGTLAKRLQDLGGKMTESVATQKVVRPLVAALAWLHEHNIVHRNLNPEHILYDEHDELRIADFFAAAVMGRSAANTREGTLAYMAPEMVSKPEDDEIFHEVLDAGLSEADMVSYDEKVDIWSLGVIVVKVLTGHEPFLADTAEKMAKVQKNEIESDRWGGVVDFVRDQQVLSKHGQEFLSSVLKINPIDRPSARALLGHAWLTEDMEDLNAQGPKAMLCPSLDLS